MSNHTQLEPLLAIHVTTFVAAIVSAVMPLIQVVFMLVSICTGIIVVYKFLKGKK
jgi:hypothetical protein